MEKSLNFFSEIFVGTLIWIPTIRIRLSWWCHIVKMAMSMLERSHLYMYIGMHLGAKNQSSEILLKLLFNVPDSKVHGSNMGPIWGRQDPGGPHVGAMNLAIWGITRERIYLVKLNLVHSRDKKPRLTSITQPWHSAIFMAASVSLWCIPFLLGDRCWIGNLVFRSMPYDNLIDGIRLDRDLDSRTGDTSWKNTTWSCLHISLEVDL